MTTKIYSIEGNIGSGKSTLVNILKEYFTDDSDYYFLEEPVSVWNTIKDKSGNTILSKFYKDQAKYAFPFQIMAFFSRISMLKQAIEDNPGKIIICERSVFTDRNVFIQMLYNSGLIEDVELEIYQKWFNEFIIDIPMTGMIYIKTDPNVAYYRVQLRAREGENISLDYLKNCHIYHEKWLFLAENKLVLNGDKHKDMKITDYQQWIEQIKSYITA